MTTRLLRACGGKITFVTDADDFSVEAPAQNRISVAEGRQRNDSHGQKCITTQLRRKEKKTKARPLEPFGTHVLLGDRSAWVYLFVKGNIAFGPAQIRPDRRSSLRQFSRELRQPAVRE